MCNIVKQSLSTKGRLYSGRVIYSNFCKSENRLFCFDQREIDRIGQKKYLQKHIVDNYKSLFFLKKKDWETEEEWRFVYYSESEEEVYIDFKDSLLGIIFGTDCRNYSKYLSFLKEKGIRAGIISWSKGHPMISELFHSQS